MTKFTKVCDACSGMGTLDHWVVSKELSEDGYYHAQRETKICKHCEGKGYTEYDVLTAEDLKDLSNDISFLANFLWNTITHDGWVRNVDSVCDRLKEIKEKYAVEENK